MNKKIVPSEQTQQEALAVARAIQKPGQTKEQTKLIAQGIEKGIALYKKQQKEKNRQADRARKKALKTKQTSAETQETEEINEFEAATNTQSLLPWILLGLSWVGFIAFWFIQNQ
ncbi:DUF2956 domain-containing protein [Vibrio diazotrophicus]|uniref:DUF2956 domain-containing protein n=1 Tax=Vibrio diazotrophicus TaxID=685 RepID=UPI00142E707D|nr:DUF2956 domain-containing protein [Vibrio diazotrophicus]NIY93003.1 DUF2956 domain-containing protein [Vibrio diazotrophicus]